MMRSVLYINRKGLCFTDEQARRIAATLEAHDVSLVPALKRRIPDDMPPPSMSALPLHVGGQ